jgi:hypothetical protein
MATLDDVRRIAISLPGATEDPTSFRFLVEGDLFAWAWQERVHLKRVMITDAWRSRAPKRLLAGAGRDIAAR